MDANLKELMISNSDSIVDSWMDEVGRIKSGNYTASISDELYENTNREFVNVIFTSIQNQGSSKVVEEFSEKMINLGWPLSYITDGLQVFRRVTIEFLLKQADQVDSSHFSNVLTSVDEWIEPLIRQLVNEYSGSWENILSLQRVALQELSAPLIPVMEGITVMPLIGTIDTDRAKLIMENLLEGAIKHNSEVVLIDITGVPVVDTMVAHHIIQAAEAVRLIGSTCILVGIRPEIAQTIINIGIDLSKFPTRSSLKKGFTRALEITGRTVVDLPSKNQGIDEIMNALKGE
ncbi:modulator protein RsbR [Oceanobacillus oncorhynchi subsp. incaldanensis]|uniref:RsbT co-antagonist protein RsbRA n=2 Tax=Oceanobacillus TaxID=182709 RepID=A0A0A1MB02_9BACI|nr:RsbT co-antagonist protein RsbRA [Oceanobacillus oncorhynchi]MDM8102653.1 RsbT co-antagonist protein RsbRA [Oceanobacillus oncorhynchi]UUI41078.1 RsbT co-antagonist protein RsbRA [Oceanobacillus oncorhynchi]GIO21331.1 modulator protein RsbR [Oceanobacillus oncorhynchi subsp. incaldanensis]CEI82530.1 RsbT co-antagonist protein RsbRA [Oceanobacillus oncorhynchi]